LPGVLAIAAPNILVAYAQLSAPTGRIAVVTFTMPVFATIFARVLLGELLDRRRVVGLILGISGLAALAWPLIRAGQFSIGFFLALFSAACWASGTVLMKRFPLRSPPLTFAIWQLGVGAFCVTVGMLVFEGLPTVGPLRTSTMLAFAYHALLGQALATVVWFEVVTKIPAGIAALGTLMVPAIGVLSATLLLGERPTAADYTGLILIMAAAATVLLPALPARVRLSGPS
jgi:drug/metabolite transporter (DMT)-like permease